MGLLDVLNSLQTGPGGTTGQGGTSPIATALLSLLTNNAQPSASDGDGAASAPPAGGGLLGGMLGGLTGGGGLGGLLKSGLGGMLGGAAAGGLLSGGVGNLLKQFEQSGHGDIISSWIGNGDNQAITPDALEKALGSDRISTLMTQSGLSRDDLLAGLSQHLPTLINHLTPNGRPPTEDEASKAV
jgi:uncharacterized protein YidB (DUF937 family)